MTEEQENKGPASPSPGSPASGAQAAQAASAPGVGARASHPGATTPTGARTGQGSSGAEQEKGGTGIWVGARADESGGRPGVQGEQVRGAKAGTESGADILSGDWRRPVFWMSCGALLAALAAGGVMLAQRVSDERDLLAVAATLPPSRPLPPMPVAAEQPDHGTAATERSVQEPRAQAARQPDDASILSGATHVPDAQQGAAPPKEARAKVRQSATRAKSAASKRQPKSAARRQASAGERYAEVFKRCPPAGVAGAVECRRHICNGAESEGPACRPYRGRLR